MSSKKTLFRVTLEHPLRAILTFIALVLTLTSCGNLTREDVRGEIVSRYLNEIPAGGTIIGFVDASQVDAATLQTGSLKNYSEQVESTGLLVKQVQALPKNKLYSLFGDQIKRMLSLSGPVKVSAEGLQALAADGSLKGKLDEVEVRRFGPNFYLVARGSKYVTKDAKPSCLTVFHALDVISTEVVKTSLGGSSLSAGASASSYALVSQPAGPKHTCSGNCCSRCQLQGVFNPYCKCTRNACIYRTGYCNHSVTY